MSLIFKSCVILLLISIGGCSSEKFKTVDQIKSSGELRVLTRTSGTTYYTNKNNKPVGFEYELAKNFAEHLGVKLEMVPISSLMGVLDGLNSGRGDLVASGLTDTVSRREKYAAGPGYLDLTQKLVCNKSFQGKTFEDLKNARMVIVKGSSYEENLREKKKTYPFLKWETISDLSSGQLLQLVWEGGPDCTVVDSHISSVNRRYMPELNEVMDVSEQQQLVWYLHSKNKGLQKEIERWRQLPETQSLLNQLKLRYFGGNIAVERFDAAIFKKEMKRTLPKYVRLFKQAGQRYNVDWRLLAALSYQESAWDPSATHPNGNFGIMMLSEEFAAEQGILDRKDVVKQIFAGAKHLSDLRNRWPPFISKENVKWMSVAAYNIGYQHIQDARRISIELNFDPNSWEGVAQVLPLLSQRRYYEDLKYGFADGIQPVIYVKRIKSFYSLLK
tara:strand:+ start:26274 stop:27605 length:1332 start_codon:yes stop_codon:yes gene_type:complete